MKEFQPGTWARTLRLIVHHFSSIIIQVPAMNADDILLDVEERMDKAIDVLKHALSGIRTGRANPGLVDSLRVEAYGSPTPLKTLASVGVPPDQPSQIVIRPFDPGTLKDIEKSIQAAGLGFNPMNDGRVLRLNVPPLSGEVRRKMVGRIKDLTEEAKVSIRNVRRDGNKYADQSEKDKKISEDDCKGLKDEIQELTKKYEARANELARSREAEVMEE
jgi:ribosome recycling factor